MKYAIYDSIHAIHRIVHVICIDAFEAERQQQQKRSICFPSHPASAARITAAAAFSYPFDPCCARVYCGVRLFYVCVSVHVIHNLCVYECTNERTWFWHRHT